MRTEAKMSPHPQTSLDVIGSPRKTMPTIIANTDSIIINMLAWVGDVSCWALI